MTREKTPGPVWRRLAITWLVRLLILVMLLPILPIGLLVLAARGPNATTVDERFSLSSSIRSPYRNTLKGAYQYSFAFCGDPHMHAESRGCFPDLDKVIRANRINFVIFGGDLTYLGREAEYRNFVDLTNGLTCPAYAVLGNHDLYNGGWSYYWRYLGPSSYSFYGGNAKFVVIDTATGQIGERQMAWIREELRANKQPLLFVVSHMPIYGGAHGAYEFPKSEERSQLIALFEKYGVDYVLEGHYHAYVDMTVNGVRYITSGSFSEGLLDAGTRHFLLFQIYGPNVSVRKIEVEPEAPVQYMDGEV